MAHYIVWNTHMVDQEAARGAHHAGLGGARRRRRAEAGGGGAGWRAGGRTWGKEHVRAVVVALRPVAAPAHGPQQLGARAITQARPPTWLLPPPATRRCCRPHAGVLFGQQRKSKEMRKKEAQGARAGAAQRHAVWLQLTKEKRCKGR